MTRIQKTGRACRSRMAGLIVAAMLLAGCEPSTPPADAYGNFEAIETTISAQSDGELLSFTVSEGDRLETGQVVGQIDTLQLSLSRATLDAQRAATASQIVSVNSEVAVLEEQRRVARIELDRIQRLVEREAATQRQLDDIEGRVSVLDRQIEATQTKVASLRSQVSAVDAQIAQLEDRISRSTVTNPINGTVLTTFVEANELVATGRPLYRIADLSSLDLRAYVSANQLAGLAIGESVQVFYDAPTGKLESMDGRVTWISSVAEFTPRTVQTRDERTNLVYAVKIRVANPDGALKIGMPADVRFTTSEP